MLQTVALHDHLPAGLAADASGAIWMADSAHTAMRFSGGQLMTFDLGGNLNNVAVDSSGDAWFAGGNTAVATALAALGAVVTSARVPGDQSGGFPWGLAIDAAAHVWASNTDLDGPVAEVDASGSLVGNSSDQAFTGALTGLVIDHAGNVWVGNLAGDSLVEIVKAAHGPQYFPFAGPVFPL